MEREQTTIRLPAELKEKLQQEADRMGTSYEEYEKMRRNALRVVAPFATVVIGSTLGIFMLIILAVICL